MFRRLLARIRDFWVAPDPAEAGPLPDDWPPPERVVHFPRRDGVCGGCGKPVRACWWHECEEAGDG